MTNRDYIHFMTENILLSEHLDLYEMTNSDDHPDLVELNRELATESLPVMWALRKWAGEIFEKVREILGGHPRHIGSGFRCAKINNATPGASIYSQHRNGQAGDIEMDAATQEQLLAILIPEIHVRKQLKSLKKLVIPLDNLPLRFHQLRFYPSRGFVHIGLETGYKDGQISWGCK